jgi:DNA polymerase-3 subunit delta
MPQVAMRAFKSALEQGTPDAVYLLYGDNDFLKDEKVRDLVDRLAEPATRDFNLEILRGEDVDAGRLSTALDALPLMASRRVLVLRDVGALKKDAKAVLDRYLGRPAPETVLVLVASAGWKAEPGIMDRASAVELRQLTEEETVTWATVRAVALGARMDDDAARLLVRATGADLALINGEIRKLRDYTGDGPITTEAVHAIVGVRAGETIGDLLDAVCARDGIRAAGLVALILSQPKTTGVSLVMSLTTQLLGIGQVLAARRAGTSPRQVAGDLYAMMGESRSSLVGRPWGEAVSAWTRHADQWDESAVERALRLLHEADATLKESGLSSDDQILSTLILAMCHRRRSRAT